MRRGFTLIEMMLVIALIAMVTAIAVGGFSLFQRQSDLNAAADTVIAIMEEARSKTLSSRDQSQYGVRFNNDRILLFIGSSLPVDVATLPAATSTDGFREYVFPSSVEASTTIAVLGKHEDAVFKRLTGETASGTIKLWSKSDTTKVKTISIQSTGIILLR
jgi:prepilin-type N-terminal cleavage/methylation domain-containing protein